jgi:hypothetical protein
MDVPTHIISVNWHRHRELVVGEETAYELVLRRLGALDGTLIWSVGLWPLPEGASLDQLDTVRSPEYMQSAGSARRMSIEVRWYETDDVLRHYVVGREGGAETGEPGEEIPYTTNVTRVFPHEVFDAEEAAGVYEHYYETGNVPPGYSLRFLDLV